MTVCASPEGPVRALHPRYYRDPEIFARERERIFYRTWQYACHEQEVAKTGDYRVFEVAGQSLFVIRAGDGTLRAFYNVCQHRAHELLQGCGNKKLISCPYHAWVYSLDGRLKRAQGSENVPGFDRDKICLSEVRLESFCGFVFVNLDAEAASMKSWYADAEADLRRFVPEIDSYRPIWTHDSPEACNWKVAVENYNECYHCRFVHPSFTKGVIAAESVDITPRDYTLRHKASAVASEKASYAFGDDAYHVIFLWPSMSIQIYPGQVVNTYWWCPTAINETHVFRGWLSPGGEADQVTMEIAEIDKKTTFVEDLPLVEAVQRGLMSRGYQGGPLVLNPKGGVDNELSIQALHGWVREALAQPE